MKKQRKIPAAVLFSGGKDSCLALHKAMKEYDVKYLLSIIPKNPDSFMFHKPYLNLLSRQAEMLDKELIILESEGKKEEELKDLEKLISLIKDKAEVIVVGGIASSYQGNRIKKICDKFKLEFYAPIWDYNQEEVWNELLENNFKVILTKISSEGLPHEILGRIIGKKEFENLKKLSKKYGFRIDFEGGEAETAVLFMPEFRKEIEIDYKIIEQGKYNAILTIKNLK